MGELSASDPDGDELAFSIQGGDITGTTSTSTGDYGTLSVDTSTCKYSYTPSITAIERLHNGNKTSDTFVFTVSDDLHLTTANYTLNLTGSAHPTVIKGDTTGAGREDSNILGTLLATDIEGSPASTIFTIATVPNHGLSRIDPSTGEWHYTQDFNYSGSDSFTVNITDVLGGTSTQRIDLAISAEDDAAVMSGDITGTGRVYGSPVTGSLTATDSEGLTNNSNYTIQPGDEPANGEATIDPLSGNWSYAPVSNIIGNDRFVVTVTDDLGGTTQQPIAITISPPTNSAPAASGRPRLQSITQGSTRPAGESISDVLTGSFSDSDSNQMSGIAITANTANPQTEGTWQYSDDRGETWTSIATFGLSDQTALFLNGDAKIRFVPKVMYAGQPGGLIVRLLDDSTDDPSIPSLNPFGLSIPDKRNAPYFADIDADGDLDAFIGNRTGFHCIF